MSDTPLSIQQERETYIREDGSTFTRADIFVKLSVAFRDNMLQTLKGPKLSVYLCIALHCGNEDMIAWPSIVTIESETGYKHTAVIGALQALEKMNLIAVEHRLKPDGSADSNRYKVQGLVTMGGSTPSVPPKAAEVVHLVNWGSTPSVPKEESMKEEKKEEFFPVGDLPAEPATPKRDYLTDVMAHKKRMKGKKSWTVTGPEGADPWVNGPVDAFCKLAHMPTAPPGSVNAWARAFEKIAGPWGVGPSDVTEAIGLISKDEKHNWRSFSSPLVPSFKDVLDVMIARVRSGETGKIVRIRN